MRGITVPVYLQFDHGSSSSYLGAQTDGFLSGKRGKWPYGVANFHGLVDRQKYDVVVEMEVPRSETNLKAGNWMVGLEMRGPPSGGGGMRSLLGWDEEGENEDRSQPGVSGTTSEDVTSTKATVLARSRRPALLTYRSRIVELAYRLLRLPLYLIGWHIESEHMEISMLESVIFEQGYRNVPTSLRLEVRSRHLLEVYRASVQIRAKLEGLRWLMYRYWLTSACVGIGLFWSVEMGVLLFTWATFTLLFGTSSTSDDGGTRKDIKSEGEESIKLEPGETEPDTPFSETSRTFPTLPSQQPLSYASPKEERATPSLEDIPTREDAEADDEEDDDFILEEPPPRLERELAFTDSGIGTSLESSVERGLARRRSGRLRNDEGS